MHSRLFFKPLHPSALIDLDHKLRDSRLLSLDPCDDVILLANKRKLQMGCHADAILKQRLAQLGMVLTHMMNESPAILLALHRARA